MKKSAAIATRFLSSQEHHPFVWVCKSSIKSIFLMSAIVAFSGCALFQEPKPAKIGEEHRFLVHLVKNSEESIAKVTRWYTGTEKNTKEVMQLNSKVALNGLQTGESVLIPFARLRTLAPMPIQPRSKKKKAAKRNTKRPEIETEEIESQEVDEISPLSTTNPQADTETDSVHTTTAEQNSDSNTETQTLPEDKPLEPDIVPIPSEGNSSPQGTPPLGSGGKTLEELVKEEQAELERLKRELEPQ